MASSLSVVTHMRHPASTSLSLFPWGQAQLCWVMFDHCESTFFLPHSLPLCPQWALQKFPETQMTAVTCDLHTGLKELSALEMGPFWLSEECFLGPRTRTRDEWHCRLVCANAASPCVQSAFPTVTIESLLLESHPCVPSRGDQTPRSRLGFSE